MKTKLMVFISLRVFLPISGITDWLVNQPMPGPVMWSLTADCDNSKGLLMHFSSNLKEGEWW